jgi:hypothetical protein
LTLPSTALAVPEPTPQYTPESTPTSTLGSTLILAPEQQAPQVLFVLREGGVIVDLVHGKQSGWAPLPEVHADERLDRLMVDKDRAGQPVAVLALRKFHLLVCRTEGARPFPCLTVVRPLNRRLQAIYGPATYNLQEPACRQRSKKAPYYRVPTAAEVRAALAARDHPQVVPPRR